MSYNPARPTKEATQFRQTEAFRLRTIGWTQQKIAEHLNISQQAIANLLKKEREKYANTFLSDVKQIKDEQILQLENVSYEAMEGWYNSKKADKEGDTRYLESFMKAKEHIRKIIGADAPTQNENLNIHVDILKKSDDELINECQQIIDKAGESATSGDTDRTEETKE